MFGRQVKSLERLRDDLPDRVVDALVEAFGHNEAVLHHEGAIVLNRGTRPEAERAKYGEFYIGEGAEAMFVGRAIGVPKWGKTVAPWVWRINPRNGRNEYLVEVRECTDWQGLILQGTTVPVYLCVTGNNQPDVNVGDTIWFVFDPKGNRVAVPSVRGWGVASTSTSVPDPSMSSSESESIWSSDDSFSLSDDNPSDSELPPDPSDDPPDSWPPDPWPSVSDSVVDPPFDPPSSTDPSYPPPDPSLSWPISSGSSGSLCTCGPCVCSLVQNLSQHGILSANWSLCYMTPDCPGGEWTGWDETFEITSVPSPPLGWQVRGWGWMCDPPTTWQAYFPGPPIPDAGTKYEVTATYRQFHLNTVTQERVECLSCTCVTEFVMP
jgi:hypothetical protein